MLGIDMTGVRRVKEAGKVLVKGEEDRDTVGWENRTEHYLVKKGRKE